jgi:hypothetical protein
MGFFGAIIGRGKIALGLILAIAFGSIGTALAMTSGSAGPRDGRPMRFAPAVGNIPIISGPAAAVVRRLAAKLPLIANARVVTETIPVSDEGATAALPVLEDDLHVATFYGSDIAEALWQANLLSGAVVDEFRARGFAGIAEAHGTLVTPDGQQQPIGGGFGHVEANQVFDDVPGSIATTIANAAWRFGLRSTRVSTVRALQPAVVIHTTTDTPTASVNALIHSGGLSSILGGSPTRFEGVYLEIRDTSGAPIYISATAARAGSATFWADPSLGLQMRGQPQLHAAR